MCSAVGLDKTSPFAKIGFGFALLCIVLLVTPFVRNLTLFCLLSAVVSVGDGIVQGSLFGLASAFPPSYLVAVLIGNGVGGVLAALLRIITKVSFAHDEEGLLASSRLYFFLSAGFTAVCVGCAVVVKKSPFTAVHYRPYDPTAIRSVGGPANGGGPAAVAMGRTGANTLPVGSAVSVGAVSVASAEESAPAGPKSPLVPSSAADSASPAATATATATESAAGPPAALEDVSLRSPPPHAALGISSAEASPSVRVRGCCTCGPFGKPHYRDLLWRLRYHLSAIALVFVVTLAFFPVRARRTFRVVAASF
jgi:hypothetical protein